ncbi:RNA-metabolising metallo-beta-lactamase [Rhizodiscina lignyota]|uniref:Cleavage and polyadenylation specificity factor subunit 2 n=1 Tax=Rhizodiscina lignyota TaxID=1504668 RepID=A0A9P4MDE1_9PEZI|nr:RNA-metabolising metallo-beta-lactamase [Rhizodiscina lignyota]
MFNFTSLLGAQSNSTASQSILELDGGVKILVDCGWDETFDAERLSELEKHIPTLSIILLTHATTAHLGAFAHCCKHFPLFTRIPVYATNPVIALGKTLLQDIYASTPLARATIPQAALSESPYAVSSTGDSTNTKILLQPPTVDEITGYFSLVHPLKYSQPHEPTPSPFSPPLNGLTIAAYSAGHSLGGTIWHIQHGLESIVYAVDWNQAREHVLSGAAWLGPAGAGGAEVIDSLRRPTALVCSSRGAERIILPGGIKKRDEVLLGHIKETVKNGGTVLIPSDSTARILELSFLLESSWPEIRDASEGQKLKVWLASRSCGATMRQARSMLEWMEEGIVRDFEAFSSHPSNTTKQKGHQRTSSKQDSAAAENVQSAPFDFKRLKIVESASRFGRALSQEGPKVILASDVSLEWGFSHAAVRQLAADPKNLIILTEYTSLSKDDEPTLQQYLWSLYEKQAGTADDNATVVISGNGASAKCTSISTEPLSQAETPLYQSYLARQRQMQNTLQTGQASNLETSADIIDDRSSASSSTSEDSDDEQQGKILNVSAVMSQSRHKLGLSDAELGINILLRRKGMHDWEVRGKKGREKMFPFTGKRKKNDEFGDLIRPEEYLRAEERDDVDGEDMRNGAESTKKDNAVGEKRKWGDMAVQSTNGVQARRMSNGVNKRRRTAEDGGSVSAEGDEDSELSSEDEGEPQMQEPEGPRKLVVKEESLQLNLRIAFVDFSGLHDKRSLQMLIPLIRPRKLILVGGDEAETQALATDCRKLLAVGGVDAADSQNEEKGADVFTPVTGETVDASVDTNAWIVKLSDPLVRILKWQNVRGLGVVALTGLLELPTASSESTEADAQETPKAKKLKAIKGEQQDMPQIDVPVDGQQVSGPPILDILPSNMAAATRTATAPLHVGDLRLADLRKLMQAAGYTAEFRGEGTLLVGGIVAVRKSGTGRIEVEGAMLGSDTMGNGGPGGSSGVTKTFYEVKKKIYEGLAVVAGS